MNKRFLLSALLLCATTGSTFAQSPAVELPGFTAYADPAEENVNINEKEGVTNWTSNSNTVNFYFHAASTGPLKVSLVARSDAGSSISLTVNGTEKTISILFR